MQTGETPLFYAIQQGNAKGVDLLVGHGAKISIENKSGLSPLQFARSKLINTPRTNMEESQQLTIKYEEIIRRLESAHVENSKHVGTETGPTLKSRAQKSLAQLVRR